MRFNRLVLCFCILCISIASFAQQQKQVRIGVLVDTFSEEHQPLFLQLQNQIAAVVGQEAQLIFDEDFIRSNNLSIHQSRKNYQEFINSSQVDLILAFGPIQSYLLMEQKEFPKPIILMGTLNKELMNLPKKGNVSGVHNLTYLVTPESIVEELSTFQDLFPYKKIGVIVDKHVNELFPIKHILDEYFKTQTSAYKIITTTPDDSIPTDQELKDIDAVYLSNNAWYKEEQFSKLVESLNRLKLPSFSALGREATTFGALFSHSSSYNTENFMRRIALSVESVVNGVNPKDIPVTIDYDRDLALNIETAFKINFPLRYSQLLEMEIVGDSKKIPSERRYTLETAIQQAFKNNLNLKVNQKNVELAKQDVKLAKSNYLPDVSAAAQGVYLDPEVAKISNGSNPEFKTDANVTLKQVIFSEEASANIKISKHQQKAQEANYNAQELDLILDCNVAYFNALIAKNNVLIQDENLRVTRKNYDIALQNFEAGQSGKSDVLRLRSELALATQNLVQAQTQFFITLNKLNEVLNNPFDLKIDIENIDFTSGSYQDYDYQMIFDVIDSPTLRDKFIHFLISEAQNNAPELSALEYNIKAAQRATSLYQKSKFLPTLALQGQYNHTLSRGGKGTSYPNGFPSPPDGTYNVALNLSLPIFQKNQRNLNRQKSIIQEEQLFLQRDMVKQSLSRNVTDGVANLVAHITNIEISKISADAAKEGLDLTQVGYSNGAVNITSLIDAQRTNVQAQQQHTNAIYNYLLAATQLERIIGYYFIMNSQEQNDDFINRFKKFALINSDNNNNK
ncbi:hypothetical protein EMN47_19810 [Prolixibacteraceae bacterium JC049]|nr:hypothetical protein [Prolixibacteraceae bacterium JC049]